MDNSAPPTNACLTDLKALIGLAEAMRAHLGQSQNGPRLSLGALDEWITKAQKLTTDEALETLGGERKIEALTMELRHTWLKVVYQRSSRYLMSPPQTQIKYLGDGTRINYPYDRWLKPTSLEHRLTAAWETPKGWHKQSMAFASAMAALSTFLQTYRGLASSWWEGSQRPHTLHWWGGYFEINKAFQLICDTQMQGRKHATQAGLNEHVIKGQTDLVVIEPIAAQLSLDVFDLDGFMDAWRQRTSKRPVTLLIDTSLLGAAFSMKDFCESFTNDPPALVVEVRSGLKLDQQGLELSNVGIMNLWTPHQDQLSTIVESLKISRTTLGVGLSHNEVAALQAPLFLDAALLDTHTNAVFANNAKLAAHLSTLIRPDQGVFGEVFHPSLGPDVDRPWAKSPFITLRYRPDNDTARGFLSNVLDFESQRRKLCFWPASSFGFRSHRYEMGYTRSQKYNTLRIAVGSRPGPSLQGVFKLFEDLAGYEHFQALRNDYPEVSNRITPDQRDDD